MSLVIKGAAISIAIAALAAPASAQTGPSAAKAQIMSNKASPTTAMAQAGPAPTVRSTTSALSAGTASSASPMARASNQLK